VFWAILRAGGSFSASRAYLVGGGFTIADIAAWGWIARADRVLQRNDDPLEGCWNERVEMMQYGGYLDKFKCG
jgi:glutathione S-transferase